MAQPASSYHHGDLRTALLAAALGAVETGGASSLSLRAVARAAGVSPMAPYHHFKDRSALVAAVAEAGFRRLYAMKLEALESVAAADPQAALIAGSTAYVAFILENPELYRLMKSAELADRSAHPDLAAAAALPSAKLAELFRALAAAGKLNTSPQTAAAMLWSYTHGLGVLVIDGYIARDRALAMAGDGARALLRGFEPPAAGA
jgi:AcrR family transcriptional regulator